MRAVVLAAGEGKRLQPLTLTRPKHMIPLAGKPILEHLLLVLEEGGVKDILIVTCYLEEEVRNYFGDGSKWGLNLDYSHQDRPLGSGHAIGLAEEYVGDEDFLVVYGDLLIDPSAIKSAIRKHKEEGLPVISIVPVSDPQQYGVVVLDGEKVVGIIEKPGSKGYGNLANAGVYIFQKAVFQEIRRTPKSPRGEIEVTDTLKRMIEKGVEFSSNMISSDGWMDIGRPWDLLEANRRVLERCSLEVKGEVEEGAHLIGSVHVEEGARLRSGTYVEGPVYIGRGCDLGPNCYIRPFTSLGQNVRVGNGCEVKNSLILEETRIGHLSYVGDSIVGANCNFGAGTLVANLRFDGKNVKVRVKGEVMNSGRRKLGVIMGDNVEVGIGVRIMPGVTVGRDSWIGPGTTVYEDVPSKAFVAQKQELLRRGLKR